jgi:DNA-entry nuclease
MTKRTRRIIRRTIAAVLLAAAAGGIISAHQAGIIQIPDLTQTAPNGGTNASEVVAPSGDYITPLGVAQILYTPKQPGQAEYCEPDQHGRAVCAYAELTSTMRAEAKQNRRQALTVDPAGWPTHNHTATIPALPASVVGDSKDYRGWFWNRSHLLADSLGGDPAAVNLVTGTRTQNVGSTQANGESNGGMAYTERIAREYLDAGRGDACPLYYAVTPQYVDDEPIPRTVLVDMRSCDASINERVEVANTANGWHINYQTGDAFSKQ